MKPACSVFTEEPGRRHSGLCAYFSFWNAEDSQDHRYGEKKLQHKCLEGCSVVELLT
jgi:hypothetical protein